MLTVDVLQAAARHMGIDLGGGQVAVAQQHLHHAQVRAVVQQMSGKGMAQRMRRQFHFHAGLQRIALDDVPERLTCHAVPTTGGEEVIGGAVEQNFRARCPQELHQPVQMEKLAQEWL